MKQLTIKTGLMELNYSLEVTVREIFDDDAENKEAVILNNSKCVFEPWTVERDGTRGYITVIDKYNFGFDDVTDAIAFGEYVFNELYYYVNVGMVK